MKVICAWCGRVLEFAESDDDEQVSHGICLDCAEIELEKAGVKEAAVQLLYEQDWDC